MYPHPTPYKYLFGRRIALPFRSSALLIQWRPLSWFLFYFAARQIMSEIWKTMSGDEREAYRSRARDDQKRYKAEQADKVFI